jgi:hypothetical protein
MNTSLTKARLTRRGIAVAACAAALFAGATACGTEDGTATARSQAASIDQLDSAKANQAEYLQRLNAAVEAARQARAEHAYAARSSQGQVAAKKSQGFGDDKRQESQARHTPPMHDAGFNKALLGEW